MSRVRSPASVAPWNWQEGRHMLASYRLGLALLADGQYDAAAASLRNALAEAPEAAAVLTALGDAELAATAT